MTDGERRARVHDLQQHRAELRARLSRHSPPVSMLVELDEMDDELARLSEEQAKSQSGDTSL